MNSSPTLQEMLDKPQFLADPVFPKKRYLNAFCGGMFRRVLSQIGGPELLNNIGVSSETEQMTMLAAPGFACWAFDLDAVFKDGRTGKQHFIERAQHDVRRPPAELVSIACTQRLVSRGVVKLTVEDQPPLKGEYQICTLKIVGWYVAELLSPG